MAVLNNIKLDFPDNLGKDFLKRLMGRRFNLQLFTGICFYSSSIYLYIAFPAPLL